MSAPKPKTAREALCVAEWAISHDGREEHRRHLPVIAALIREQDGKRPLGSDGKHGNLHTPECGCEDAPEPPVRSSKIRAGDTVEAKGTVISTDGLGMRVRFPSGIERDFDPADFTAHTPAPTLVERMVEEYTVAVGHEENGMQAALAEVAAWVAEQRHLDYREDLLAALRAEAGQSDG